MFCISVVFEVHAAHAAEFGAAVAHNARESLAREAGCQVFDVCVDDSGRRFFLYEIYDDAAAFDAHLQSPHFKAFDAMAQDWVRSKTVGRWQRLPP
jgi:(4S)-4-hydroxy-5-phosphonooxypentane-2,3-dione isomerase